jgi:hypothetical protein
MKKVINYLGLRKVAINLQLDKLPADVDQYVAEIGSELEEELRQIDQALVVLSNVVGRSGQLPNKCKVCGRTNEERLTMTSMCGVSACPY